MKREVKNVLAFMGSIWLVMPLYIILHEGGHAIVALMCGAKITTFNILDGYVIADGGSFDELASAIFYMAGLLLPVIVFTIFLIGFPFRNNSSFGRILPKLLIGCIFFSLAVWVVVPIQYIVGRANMNDDVVRFIEVLKVNPITVSILSGLVLSIYIWRVYRRKRSKNDCSSSYLEL